MFNVYNEKNQKINCEILFTFSEKNKNFIIYKDDLNNILASYYNIFKNKVIILPITNDNDYDIVDNKLEEWRNSNEKW